MYPTQGIQSLAAFSEQLIKLKRKCFWCMNENICKPCTCTYEAKAIYIYIHIYLDLEWEETTLGIYIYIQFLFASFVGNYIDPLNPKSWNIGGFNYKQSTLNTPRETIEFTVPVERSMWTACRREVISEGFLIHHN